MGTFMETQLRFLSFSREDKVDKEKLNYEKTQIDRRKLSSKLKESGSSTAVDDICEQRRKETAKIIIIISRYYLIILSKGENDEEMLRMKELFRGHRILSNLFLFFPSVASD